MSSWKDVHKGRNSDGGLKGILALWDHFADDRIIISALTGYDPESKEPLGECKITIFYELGRIKLSVSDPRTKRVGFVTLEPSHPTLGACIVSALQGGLDWRQSKESPQGGFRR